MTTLQLRKSIDRSRLRLGFLLTPLVLVCFGLALTTWAVDPPPDGGYPNLNTAEGDDALFSLQRAQATRPTVLKRSLATPRAASTRLSVFMRFIPTPLATKTRPSGVSALRSNTTGNYNTANGVDALYTNITGSNNTANGVAALHYNTTGSNNTATGFGALAYNTTGINNTANGDSALFSNTTGIGNTANGLGALYLNTIGNLNTANGELALFSNTTADNNTANGFAALFFNTTDENNTANGYYALKSNTTGGNNIALGFQAGLNLTTGNNNIDIGNAGAAAESNTIRIGSQGTQTKTFIAGVSGTGVMGAAVKVNAAGQLGTAPSSARFKQNIKPMDTASEAIHALKPVSFHYKKEVDPEAVPQFGLVAEDVEKVNPDLVARDHEGKPYTVRYEAVNAMLLNEFLKEHRIVEEQRAAIAELKKGLQAVTARLTEQEAQIQKVSAQFEVSKAVPQIVASDR